MLAAQADVLRRLRTGTCTLEELYTLCEQRVPMERDGGHDLIPSHPGDRRWKQHVRGTLEGLRRTGHADRIGRPGFPSRVAAQPPTTVTTEASASSCSRRPTWHPSYPASPSSPSKTSTQSRG
jgi:hypothetical protein